MRQNDEGCGPRALGDRTACVVWNLPPASHSFDPMRNVGSFPGGPLGVGQGDMVT